MMRMVRALVFLVALLVLAVGCSKQTKRSQISGKVTFKGKPVPAGFISFMPDSSKGNKGPVTTATIKNGEFDSAKEEGSGYSSGAIIVTVTGFDGKPDKGFPQGKQIFNAHQYRETLPEGGTTKNFEVPISAADDLKIVPTLDP